MRCAHTESPEGFLYGTMTLELGGKVTIECEKTKCYAELEFKLKVHVNKLADDSLFTLN